MRKKTKKKPNPSKNKTQNQHNLREEVSEVVETLDLELLGLALDDLPVDALEHPCGSRGVGMVYSS